jgi:membrane protein insertase Oxa1/YidC/SpoIIIJ
MNRNQIIIITFLVFLSLICLTYTIVDQQKQINQLKGQLQQEKLKYKMLYRDPIVREAIESGG